MIYSSVDYFIENYGSEIPEEQIEKQLKRASKEIDKYLIWKPTSGAMSEYEIEVFNDVCCELAIFLNKNGKYINNVVNSLSIAGTSYSFDNATIEQKKNDILVSLNDTRFMNRCL